MLVINRVSDILNLKGILYGGYEELLASEIRGKPIPSHVAIIMDGNRRFALKHGLSQYYGHLKGQTLLKKSLTGALTWA